MDDVGVVNEQTSLLGPRPGPDGRPGDGQHDDELEQESWHTPKINTYRFATVNLTLLIMGMNDACIGVSLENVSHPTNL